MSYKKQKIIQLMVEKKKVTMILGSGKIIKFYCAPLDAVHLKNMLEEVLYVELEGEYFFPKD